MIVSVRKCIYIYCCRLVMLEGGFNVIVGGGVRREREGGEGYRVGISLYLNSRREKKKR